MAETRDFPRFPPLTWDGWCWRADFTVPWYPTEGKVDLIIRPDFSRFVESADARSAPHPTSAQAAAFQHILDPKTPLNTSFLAAFQQYVPELASADWDDVPAFFEMATVLIFHPSLDDVSYTGFVLNCLQYEYGYEHGVGIVAHRERIVHFGMAEEAQDETQALKDQQRIARSRRSSSDKRS
jgi:hypothetical protein